MMKTTVCFIVLWMCIAFSEAQNGCPLVPCPAILYPAHCRSVTFFIQGKDQVCQSCDRCKEKVDSKHLDKKGCPRQACNKKRIPDGCRRDIYYVYQGRVICEDCPQDTCLYS
ncbi:uncharacterized protein LOC123527962 [Mercenaria mercenaria]|uniref:uncharacterized protein LOC123527962 n=1 Tax=Mercenaria mercenaria TaxID=6596 RepID=UPI001E1DE6FD|nr:uncharacterized protein LOC123527962 [Mercenaria mercenaria]